MGLILPSSDLDRSRRFYHALGLREIPSESPGLVTFEGTKGRSLDLYQSGSVTPAAHPVARFMVHDLDRVVRSLEEEDGLTFLSPTDLDPADGLPPLARMVAFRDPDGHLWLLSGP